MASYAGVSVVVYGAQFASAAPELSRSSKTTDCLQAMIVDPESPRVMIERLQPVLKLSDRELAGV